MESVNNEVIENVTSEVIDSSKGGKMKKFGIIAGALALLGAGAMVVHKKFTSNDDFADIDDKEPVEVDYSVVDDEPEDKSEE